MARTKRNSKPESAEPQSSKDEAKDKYSENIRIMYESKMADLKVTINGKVMSSSRLMWAAQSPVLAQPIYSDISQGKITTTVDMPKVTVSAFKIICDWIHGIHTRIPLVSLAEVYYAASIYKMDCIMIACQQKGSKSKCKLQEWLNVLLEIDKYNDIVTFDALLEKMVSGFLMDGDNAAALLEAEGLLKMSEEMLVRILDSDRLSVDEEDIWTLCWKYSTHWSKKNTNKSIQGIACFGF